MRLSIALLTLIAASPAFAKDKGDAVVREVNKGTYMKSGIGVTPYFQKSAFGGSLLSPVMTVDLSVGSDIVDKERLSMAVEAQFSQQLQDGPTEETLALEPPIVQGDVHIFGLTATYEVSGYITRRFSVGARAGGGVSIIPLLMDKVYYGELVVPAVGAEATSHKGPQPTIRGGATIEYYTKLSHFSVGADVDALFVIGSIGLGVSPVGYLKYTF